MIGSETAGVAIISLIFAASASLFSMAKLRASAQQADTMRGNSKRLRLSADV